MQSKLNFTRNLKTEKVSLNKNVNRENKDNQNQQIKQTSNKLMESDNKPIGSKNKTIESNRIDSKETTRMKQDYKKLRQVDDSKYDVRVDCPFEPQSAVPFEFLTCAFEIVSQIKGANSKEKQKDILSNVFRTIQVNSPLNMVPSYYICTARTGPDYLQRELGIGDAIIIKALSKCSGRTEKQIRESINQLGDLGKVAMQSRSQQKTMDSFFKNTKKKENGLTVLSVFNSLVKMSETKGNNAENEKQSQMIKLFMECRGEEIQYIVRFIQGNLKIGFAEASMQSALCKGFYQEFGGKDVSLEVYEQTVKRAMCEYPNQQEIIEGMIKVRDNIKKLLDICHVKPGIPIKPMLAKPMKDISVILKRFQGIQFTCEYKYDGLRGQIHFINGDVQIYSRNLQNMNETYPDIIQFIRTYIPEGTKPFVMDSEIVAIDRKSNKILPFQTLTTRSRKNVDVEQIEIDVCVFMFDLLYFDDRSLLQTSFQERRNIIKQNFKEVENRLVYAVHKDTEDMEEIEEILVQSVKDGCEGLMIKTLDTNSSYEPAKRSFKWLKLKKDYLEGNVGDTFDLVPIGAFYGTGKRKGYYGSFLLACYNPDMEVYETTCKIGTGFSDEMLQKLYEKLSEETIVQPLDEYRINQFKCDVWFRPCMVWEVKAADLQQSPIYTSCIDEQKKGVGLRFPRFIAIRTDKDPQDASTSRFVYELYCQQSTVQINFDQDDLY